MKRLFRTAPRKISMLYIPQIFDDDVMKKMLTKRYTFAMRKQFMELRDFFVTIQSALWRSTMEERL